jgi:hypothetical protein
MSNDHSLISLDAREAHGAWGFVGVVRVGDHEAFRTLRSYPVPSDARAAVEQLLAHVLGAVLRCQEHRAAADEPRPCCCELGSWPTTGAAERKAQADPPRVLTARTQARDAERVASGSFDVALSGQDLTGPDAGQL